MRFFANANYPFLQWRRRAYLVSAAMLLLGIGAMIYNYATTGSWLNYGVDFSGGTVVQVDFREPTSVEQIRAAVAEPGWEITRFGEADEFVIRMPIFDQQAGSDAATLVTGKLATAFSADDFTIVRTEAVGPKVGEDLQTDALIAILLSLLATMVYLAIRFEWRFGLAALVATFHDIVITLGFLALLRSEISIGTVAAFLTIVGYSLNDTIIVFDRVRENLAKARADLRAILDRSINETLPRTILTTGTTLLTLLSLYVFGGAVIRDFAMVLILGIAVGTFSSIFVASPALYAIEGRWPRRDSGGRRPVSADRSRAGATV